MQGDFKSYFSIYGNRLLLIIVVDTPIIPKDDNVIQPIGILHRHLTYWSIFCVCRRRIKQKSFDKIVNTDFFIYVFKNSAWMHLFRKSKELGCWYAIIASLSFSDMMVRISGLINTQHPESRKRWINFSHTLYMERKYDLYNLKDILFF